MARNGTGEAEIRRRVGAVIRARAGKVGPAVLARAAEIDDSQMSKVLSGKVGLSLYSLSRVAGVLGTTAAAILEEAIPNGVVPRIARARSNKSSNRSA